MHPSQTRCGIEEAEFIYQLPPRHWCYNYSFTVTTQNLAGMGESSSISHVSPAPKQRELQVTIFSVSVNDFIHVGPVVQGVQFTVPGSEIEEFGVTLNMVREVYINFVCSGSSIVQTSL